MKKVFSFVLCFLGVMLLASCSPVVSPVEPSDPSVQEQVRVVPESDNEYSWSGNSLVYVDTTAYRLTVTLCDDAANHTEVGAAGSVAGFSGYVVGSYRVWQDGKGLLPVELVEIEPDSPIDGIEAGTTLILKTSDLKAIALPTGATTVFVCNLDTEVLSPVNDRQVLTTDRLTYEFDDCRMLDPTWISDDGAYD